MSEYIIRANEKDGRWHYIELMEEIVRCRDCTNYEPNNYIHFTCEYLQRWAEPYDYCVWGERKERIEL